MKLNPKWIVVALVLVGLVSCRTAQLVNLENISMATASGKSLTLDQVKQAITRGGSSGGWVMSPAGPGHLIGTLSLRSHVAIIDITFDTKTYSVKYKDSTDLKYRKDPDGIEYIHSNYSGWISNLRKDINQAVVAM